MRQPLTFVVTLLPDERNTSDLRGRVRDVAGERESAFRHADELLAFLRHEAEQHARGPSNPPYDEESAVPSA